MRLAPLLLLAPLLACGPAPAREVAAPVWHAKLVATVGADSGPASFLSIRSLLFSPAGELYVVDDRERQVKVFDSTGKFLRPLGRSGAGPGEYADPYSVGWLGDTLALLDPGNARIGLFDTHGGWLGMLHSQRISGGRDIRLYRTPLAALWALESRSGKGFFFRYTSAGAQDSLPLFWRAPVGTTVITCQFPDRSLHFFEAPFAPTDLQIPTPAGFRAIARTDSYRIDLLKAEGDTTGTVKSSEVGAPISDGEWEAGLEEWRSMRKETPTAKCDADGFDRPATKPILAAIFYDPRGWLWVEVRTPEGPRYDVYDSTGIRIASVTGLPTSGDVDPAFLGDRIAIVLPGDDGSPRIGIYQAVTERTER